MTNKLERIADKLLELRGTGEVFLYPHVGVDGDALGSSLALMLAMRSLDIGCRFLYDENIPEKYSFLPGFTLIEQYELDNISQYREIQQLALAVDCTDASRTGQRQALFDLAPQVAVIDHHVSGEESGPLHLIKPEAAATGEIVYDLLCLLEEKTGTVIMNKDIATLLMTTLLTDTGRFTFSNTTGKTFDVAARLMKFNINLRQITYMLYDLSSKARFRLTGKIFNDTWFSENGKIALAKVSVKLLEEFSADESDLDGIVNKMRNVEGVSAAFLLREMKNGQIRVNIRSDENFDASGFARLFGGGGHARAAGIQFAHAGMEETAEKLIRKAGEMLG